MFDEIRKGLFEAYKHKKLEGFICIVCGAKNRKLALHVIEFYHSDSVATPKCFVQMSHSRGTLRGSVPICDKCCPPCSRCNLPIVTTYYKKIIKALSEKFSNISFSFGNGICKHIHIQNDILANFKSVKLNGATVDTHELFNATTAEKVSENSLQLDHELGINVVVEEIRRNKFDVVEINTNRSLSPQIVAKKNNRTHFFVVITSRSVFPELTDSIHKSSCEHAKKFQAVVMFAPVQILPTGERNDRGQEGFYVKYLGFSCVNDPLGLYSDDPLAHTIQNLAKQAQLSAASGKNTTFGLPDFVRRNMLKSDIVRVLKMKINRNLIQNEVAYKIIMSVDLEGPLGDMSDAFDKISLLLDVNILQLAEQQARQDDKDTRSPRYTDLAPLF